MVTAAVHFYIVAGGYMASANNLAHLLQPWCCNKSIWHTCHNHGVAVSQIGTLLPGHGAAQSDSLPPAHGGWRSAKFRNLIMLLVHSGQGISMSAYQYIKVNFAVKYYQLFNFIHCNRYKP